MAEARVAGLGWPLCFCVTSMNRTEQVMVALAVNLATCWTNRRQVADLCGVELPSDFGNTALKHDCGQSKIVNVALRCWPSSSARPRRCGAT